MQVAGQRNARVLYVTVQDSGEEGENTFLPFVQGGGKKGLSEAGREFYTLLDYIALSWGRLKTAKKGTE